jgi:hypothetical protein
VTRTTGHTPWDLFEREEKACLKSLPATDYECALWQELKVHRDHHVVFEGSYYSVPSQYIGQKIWLRASLRMVEIYANNQKIKSHIRSQSRGQWITDSQDYPQYKQEFLDKDKAYCLQKAEQVGPFTKQFLEKILKSPTLIGQRKAQAILRLAASYGEGRLESACQRSISFDNYAYRSLKKILAHGYEKETDLPAPPALGYQTIYTHSLYELAPLQGAVS